MNTHNRPACVPSSLSLRAPRSPHAHRAMALSPTQMWAPGTFALLLLLLAAAACAGPVADERTGYTECGSITCQPGQYCESQRASICTNGCLSDDNCQPGDQCYGTDLSEEGDGRCVASEPETDPGSSGDLEPGYTACGPTVCSPGQYCASALMAQCNNGCTSDANCLGTQVCGNIDSVHGDGICEATESEHEVNGDDDDVDHDEPANPLAACKEACGAFQQCGMGAEDVAACRQNCEAWNDDQRVAVAGCKQMACSDQPACLGGECFTDDHCPIGEDCGGGVCY